VEDAVEAEGVAGVVAVDVAVRAAIAQVPLLDRHLVLARPQPLLHEVRLRVGTVEEVRRRLELALDVDERHARWGADLSLTHRSFLACDSVRCRRARSAGTQGARRAGGSARPRTPGISPATRSRRATARVRDG